MLDCHYTVAGVRPSLDECAAAHRLGDPPVLVLRQMTGFLWRSAFVAAVFAIHPLRVESVAWVAERKDVLSGLFFMLTLWAYARYAQRVTRDRCQVTGSENVVPASILSRVTCHPSLFYGLVLLFFALGLLSKNMLVTMPFVLLLLDFWPLGRLSSFSPRILFRRWLRKSVVGADGCIVRGDGPGSGKTDGC